MSVEESLAEVVEGAEEGLSPSLCGLCGECHLIFLCIFCRQYGFTGRFDTKERICWFCPGCQKDKIFGDFSVRPRSVLCRKELNRFSLEEGISEEQAVYILQESLLNEMVNKEILELLQGLYLIALNQ